MKEATLNKKIEQVQAVSNEIKSSKSAVIVNVIGLTVAEVSELRTNLYNAGCQLKVIKNNIIRRAVKDAGYEGLDEVLVGPNAVAFSSDTQNAAKVLNDFVDMGTGNSDEVIKTTTYNLRAIQDALDNTKGIINDDGTIETSGERVGEEE